HSLSPDLTIGGVSGDLWHRITLTNIVLSQGSAVFSVDTLELDYSLLSYLSHTFKVHRIRVIHPVLKLEGQDGAWNIENWLKPSSDTTTGSTAAYTIHNLVLKRGRIVVAGLASPKDSSFAVDNLKLVANNINL